MENTLTVKEAIEQGYEHYLVDKGEYGHLRDISDFEDETEDEVFLLADKEYSHPKGLPNGELQEMLADNIWDNYCSDTGCDTNEVYDLIKAIDFSDVSERIDKALESVKYKRATKIRLIP